MPRDSSSSGRATPAEPPGRSLSSRRSDMWVRVGSGGLWGVLLVLMACVAREGEAGGSVWMGLAVLVPFLLVAVGVWAAWWAAREDARRDE